MNLESAKGIWDYLKKKYQGNERTKIMQVLNLIKQFNAKDEDKKHQRLS